MDSSKKKNPQKSVITKRYKIPDEVRRTSEYLKKKSTCNVYTDPSLKTRLIQTDIVKKFKVPNYDISKMNKIDTRTHLCVASTNQRIQANEMHYECSQSSKFKSIKSTKDKIMTYALSPLSNIKIDLEGREEDLENFVLEDPEEVNRKNLYRNNVFLYAKSGDKQGFLSNLTLLCSGKITRNVVNSVDSSGFTCLHYASREGNLQIVDLLLKYNANPNIKNSNGETSLHLAVSNSYFDISKMLIKFGGDVKMTDKAGNTPIHLCSEKGNPELLKFLLSNLDTQEKLTKNSNKKTPLDLAHDGRILSILKDFYYSSRNSIKKVQIYNSTSDRTKHKNSACIAIKCSHISINLLNLNSPYPKKKSTFCKRPDISLTDKSKQRNVTRSSTSKNIDSKVKIGKELNLAKNNDSNHFNIIVNSSKPLSTKNAKNSLFHSPLLFVFNQSNKSKSSSKSLRENLSSTTKVFHLENKFKRNEFGHDTSITLSNKSRKGLNMQSSKSNKINLVSNSCVPKTNLILNNKKSSFSKPSFDYDQFRNSIKSSTKSASISSISKGYYGNHSNKACSEFLLDLDPSKAKWRLTNLNYNQEKPKNILSQNLIKAIYDKKCLKSFSQDLNNKENAKSTPTQLLKENHSKIITQTSGQQQDTKNDSHYELSTDNIPLEKISFLKYSHGLRVNSLNQSNNTDNTRRLNDHELEITDENFFRKDLEYKAISELTPQMNRLKSMNDKVDRIPISVSSFSCIGLIGKGSFGEVYLVEQISTRRLYAMKVLLKSKLIDQNLLGYAITERNVLSVTRHPFIVNLHYSFQTKERLFLILDYCPAGDLSKHLAMQGKFKEEHAKFYICEMILAIEDLHRRDIIYRDLKPDNIVLDFDGHALLTDFGLSKQNIKDEDSTKSFCGSVAYLAPEMIDKTGHGKCIDWYLLGVLFFEMLVGIPPFFSNDREQMFKNIKSDDLKIPKNISEGAADLLKGLLDKDPSKRLGSSKYGANEIKQHQYFQDIDWDLVYNKKLVTPKFDYELNQLKKFSQPRLFEENWEMQESSISNTKEPYCNNWSYADKAEE